MRSLPALQHFAFIPTTTAQTPGQGDTHRHQLNSYIHRQEQEQQTHIVVDKNAGHPLYLSQKNHLPANTYIHRNETQRNMSDNVYAKISEKMKNERFTDEEIKTVEKAKEQLSSYSKHSHVLGIYVFAAGSATDFAGTDLFVPFFVHSTLINSFGRVGHWRRRRTHAR